MRSLSNTLADLEKCQRRIESLERDLLATREASQKALQAKADFLSNMNHELRTPLSSVIGMSEVLWETDLSPEQRKVLSSLITGGRTLLALINDVLDFSRIENGRLPIERVSFRVEDSVSRVVELVRASAQRKNLSLEVEIRPGFGAPVKGDPMRLEQILTNLLSNAIKFTERGRVSIRVERKPDAGEEALFIVEDTGIGIPAEKLNDIFDRFSQLDMSVTKTYGGTGLGLAICKQLVEMMNGQIWVTSRVNEGTVFQFTLPLAAQVESHAEVRYEDRQPESLELESLKVLVVEDSPDNAFLISNHLRNIGCHLDFAENGREAIEMFERNDYDLVLMDIQMPEMDGYSAVRWMRVLEKRRDRRVPMIALSAYTAPDEVQKALDSGFDSHVGKPFDKRSLLQAIASQID